MPAPSADAAVALSLRGLRKSYGSTVAVASVDLEVRRGEIVGLIGPDGAGKTTTMRVALGLLRPDAGEVEVLGARGRDRDRRLKEKLGYMPQRFSLYPDLTVAENLRFFADLYLVPPAERARQEASLFEFSRLGPFRDRRAGALSGGMKQKLALSCNLIHQPELLILDEPTTGVDPVSRQEFWGYLRDFAAQGLAILVSTPYMDEAALCHRVLLMHGGEVIARGTPEEVRRLFPHRLLAVRAEQTEEVRRALLALQLPGVSVLRFGDTLHVVYDDEAQGRAVAQALAGRPGVDSEEIEATIEDVFVDLAGGRAQEGS